MFPAPSFSPIVASMIGLGVGVDYALFISTRFREALHDGQDAGAAAVTAMRTAGRTVLIAGTTVVIGMLGLLVLRQQLLNGVAMAAAATVAMVLLGSLTLLPALLGFTGTRLAGRRGSGCRGWLAPAAQPRRPVGRPTTAGLPAERWAGMVQRRPVLAAAGFRAALLLLLAAPALGMKLSMPDESGAGPRDHGVRELRHDGARLRRRVSTRR